MNQLARTHEDPWVHLIIDSGVEKTINAGPRGRIEHFIPKEGYYSSKAL